MTEADRWNKLKDLFEASSSLSSDERAEFLQKILAVDQSLAKELSALLVNHEAKGFLDEPLRESICFEGQVIASRYEIVRQLGKGGMGEVYEAHDTVLNDVIALKIIHPENSAVETTIFRFIQELQLARKVTHPNVCRVFDIGRHSSQDLELVFLTMELIDGETLASYLSREAPLNIDMALHIGRQIADGIAAAHALHIVHRDLKPGNVMLTKDARVLITDFGLAMNSDRTNSQVHTIEGCVIGTIQYMSPEQRAGERITSASDMYALAVILYEMVTARRPTEAPTAGSAELPANWKPVLDQALQVDPAKRFESANKFITALISSSNPLESENQRRPPFTPSHFLGKRTIQVSLIFAIFLLALFCWKLRFNYWGVANGAKIIAVPTVNATGEPRFNGLTAVFQASLGQSAHFDVWDNQRLASVLREMRRGQNSGTSPKDWREIAFREGVPLLVFSTLSRIGSGYAFTVHCEQIGSAPDPPVRSWDQTFTGSSPNTLFDALHEATTWLRTSFGENAAEISQRNLLVQDITSSSWEALELYGDAERLNSEGRVVEEISVLRRAVQLDSQFALAQMLLGDALNSQRNEQEGFTYWRQAIALGRNQRLSDRERFILESRYNLELGNYPEAESNLREWNKEFPFDTSAGELLTVCLIGLGRYPEALTLARRHEQSFGPSLFVTARIIEGLAMTNHVADIDSELTVLHKLQQYTWELRFRGILAAVKKDYDGAERSFHEWAQQTNGEDESRAVSLLATLAAERGDFGSAATLLEKGITYDRQMGQIGLASQKASALAFIESIRGNHGTSRNWALEAVGMLASNRVLIQSASILARQGFLKDATRVEQRLPAGSGSRYEVGQLRIRGEILAAQGKYDKAVEVMEKAAHEDLAIVPKEYLARVLVLAGQRDRARIYYSEIVEHPWLVWEAPESEWPGLRFLSNQFLENYKGE